MTSNKDKHQDPPAVESWPRVFSTVENAVTWADLFLNDPGIVTATAVVQRDRVQRSKLTNTDLSTLRDMAETVTVELCRVPRPAGQMFRAIFGINTQKMILADYLAHECWSGPGKGCVASRKTIAQARDLAFLVMADYREQKLFNGRVTIKEMAEAMKMERQKFYEQWFETVSCMREKINMLLSQATRALEESLTNIGIVERFSA